MILQCPHEKSTAQTACPLGHIRATRPKPVDDQGPDGQSTKKKTEAVIACGESFAMHLFAC